MSETQTEGKSELAFEEALVRLEAIVAELEAGDTGLEASLSAYERGVKLLRHCHGILQRAERKIELLTGVDAQGQATAEPFDDTATFSDESAATTRSQKRSAGRSASTRGARPRSEPPEQNLDEAPKLF